MGENKKYGKFGTYLLFSYLDMFVLSYGIISVKIGLIWKKKLKSTTG